MGKNTFRRKRKKKDFLIILLDNYSSMAYRSITSKTIPSENHLKDSFFQFKVIPGPEADNLMKSWVAEQEEER
jgi:hypothetical protein